MILDDKTLCVLLTVNGVRDELPGWDEDDVKAACHEHALSPAFDIGLGGRSELRVTRSGLEFLKRTGGARRRRVEWREVLAEVLRGCEAKPFLYGERARLILNCSADHVNHLVDTEELETMPGTERRRGPNGSDCIQLASFSAFLQRRMT